MARTFVIVCSIISLTALVTIILVACSMSVLTYNEIGLNYSNWFKTVEEKTYTHGIHFIGLGHAFQKYDIKLNTIEFSNEPDANLPMIKCRTSDGLELDLEASLQYRVSQDDGAIFKIYTHYGPNEKDILMRVVVDVISDTSTEYSSNDFFTKRSIIQERMLTDLRSKVLAATWHEIIYFQLRSISLPDAFEEEIENTEVKGQDIHTADAEVVKATVIQKTNVMIAELAVNATIETAMGNAKKITYEAEAVKSTVEEVVKNQAEAFGYMKTNLTFGVPEVINYLKTNLVKDYPEGKLAISLDL